MSVISSLVVADFNGDGFLDISATDGFDELVIFMPGNGDGMFGLEASFAAGFTDAAVAIEKPGFQPSIALATEQKQLRVIRNLTPAKEQVFIHHPTPSVNTRRFRQFAKSDDVYCS